MELIDPRKLLVRVARILEDLDVPYAVTDGMAVFVWARPRFTADIDIIVMLRPQHLDRLADKLSRLSEASYISTGAMRRALERRGEFNFIDGSSGVKVDFWVLGQGDFEKLQLERRKRLEVLGHPVFFVSPEDLMLSKLCWYKEGDSAQQREDLLSILRIQRNLDMRYIKKWAKLHSTLGLLNELLRERQG